MASAIQIECPVCTKLFSSEDINKHVDECLTNTTDSADQDVIVGKSENQAMNRKRKSDSPNRSGWGFLRAASNTQIGQTSKKHRTQTNKQTEMTVNNSSQMLDRSKLCPINGSEMERVNTAESARSPEGCVSLSFNQRSFKQNGKTGSDTTKEEPVQTNIDPFKPLAEQMRPTCFEDYIGHDKEVGGKSMLGALLQSDNVPSMVLWGPPGCGKTTLARVIAHKCKTGGSAKFIQLSAAAAGVNDVKEVIKIAKNDMKMFRKRTVLFLDEIHRFNKTQQDTLLPHVEDGSITLIGATTENPSFQVNSALLSRCRVIVLEKLASSAVEEILRRAITKLKAGVLDEQNQNIVDNKNSRNTVWVEKEALETLSHLCDGDARIALNGLQMAIQSQSSKFSQSRDSLHTGNKPYKRTTLSNTKTEKQRKEEINTVIVRTEHVKEGLQRSHILYDRAGEEHYNIISALHKSMRGSDDNAALYWLARMLEGGETPLYVARRLVRFASEDIGLADPLALNQAVAAYQACHFIGMPECEVILAQCVVYLSRAPKSIEVYWAYDKAKKCVRSHQGPLPSVPLHLRNAPTKLMKDLGYSKGYKYNPSFSEPVDQEYFPEGLIGTNFFK